VRCFKPLWGAIIFKSPALPEVPDAGNTCSQHAVVMGAIRADWRCTPSDCHDQTKTQPKWSGFYQIESESEIEATKIIPCGVRPPQYAIISGGSVRSDGGLRRVWRSILRRCPVESADLAGLGVAVGRVFGLGCVGSSWVCGECWTGGHLAAWP
jgi:hypothetical protein